MNFITQISLILILLPSLTNNAQQISLSGSGSSLAAAFYDEVIQNFQSVFPNIHVTYTSTNSGIGVAQLIQGLVNFAGSDVPLTADQIAQFKTTPLTFPTVLAGVSLAYNLPGNPEITLTANQIAGIYLGTITDWHTIDASIPSTPIVPFARSDSSGTSSIFTQYLAATIPNWPSDLVGLQPAFTAPVVLLNGTTAIVQALNTTVGGIGYVGFNKIEGFANLANARIVNSSNKAIAPSVNSIAAAGTTVQVTPDLVLNAINSSNPEAYPITDFTNIIVNSVQPSLAIRIALAQFLRYIATTGQQFAADNNFAPLPESVVNQFLLNLGLLTAPGVSTTANTIINKYCIVL